ncbi:SDR family NAD(P)-dependent oxidoreductase [Nonomuraea sp. KM90]|uniref:SDR family NAD(P)-dependent oxidoreductase n=1 Tax=Nonomuraea sp. KM90 TaxID=3457428 RepID=UPI003FCCB1EA
MELGLRGKNAIVTGGSSGIGLAVVQELLREGVNVIAASRYGSQELNALNERDSLPVESVLVDLARPGGATVLAARAREVFGDDIDYWVNCVGNVSLACLQGDLAHVADHWREAFEINLGSAVRVAEAIMPSLINRKGAIVHVAGLAPHAGTPTSPVDYTAAKTALISFSQSVAAMYGPQGVRSNTVSPAPTATRLWDRVAKANMISVEAIFATVPPNVGMTTGRMVRPSEVAALVLFLLSDSAASMNGTDYRITAGMRL